MPTPSSPCWPARLARRTRSTASMAWSRCAAASRSSSPPPHGDRFMSARLRIPFALLWLGVLLLAGLWISAHLQLTGDLRKFMPAPETPEQKLLIDELGEGPGSRLLLVALSGADAPTLAAQYDRKSTRLNSSN